MGPCAIYILIWLLKNYELIHTSSYGVVITGSKVGKLWGVVMYQKRGCVIFFTTLEKVLHQNFKNPPHPHCQLQLVIILSSYPLLLLKRWDVTDPNTCRQLEREEVGIFCASRKWGFYFFLNYPPNNKRSLP